MNKNFFNDLSLYCTPYIYDKLNNNISYQLYTKKIYLISLLESQYSIIFIPYLSLEDFIYVMNFIDDKKEYEDEEIYREKINTIFDVICVNGDEEKIKYICEQNLIDEVVYDTFDIKKLLKLIIPHKNKDLLLFLIKYFKNTTMGLLYYIELICVYDFNFIECLNFGFVNINNKDTLLSIFKTIDYNRFEIYKSLMDYFFKENQEIISLRSIVDYCIDKNKLAYLSYINEIKPMKTFYNNYNNKKIKSFDVYLFLRKNIINSELLDKSFFYNMLHFKNNYLIEKCIELNPHLICVCNHASIEIADKSIRQQLINKHICKREISINKKNMRINDVLDNISIFSESISTIFQNII